MRNVILTFIFVFPFCLSGQGKKVCSKSILSAKLKANDTLFITQTSFGQSEKLGIIKLEDGRYKALQYNGTSNEIFQDFTVPAPVFESVVKAEKALKQKTGIKCKDITYVFKLKKKYYSITENNCENTALDRMKAQLFLVQNK